MKRFYTAVSVASVDGSWQVLLDGKPIHTPKKRVLVLPNEPLAGAVAQEWLAQGDVIDKHRLPLTGYATLALDVIADARDEVTAELLGYGDTDLLLYRDDREPALQQEQHQHWQHWLDWAKGRYGTRYVLTEGVMPVGQPQGNRDSYLQELVTLDTWQLAGLAAVVKAAGSLVLGLAFIRRHLDAYALLRLSRLEEEFNIARWGLDTEAAERRDRLARELDAAQTWRDYLPG